MFLSLSSTCIQNFSNWHALFVFLSHSVTVAAWSGIQEWKKSTSGLRTSFKNAVLQLPNYVACIDVRQTAPRRVNLILQGSLASIGKGLCNCLQWRGYLARLPAAVRETRSRSLNFKFTSQIRLVTHTSSRLLSGQTRESGANRA